MLITGGLGYLGGRLAAGLLQSGHSVRLGTSRANPTVPYVLQMADLKVIDLQSIPSLREACRGVHAILHLAALNANECALEPERALLVNATGTSNLVQAASEENVNQIIYFSTAHVYGAPLCGELDELSVPRPAHPYAITHRSAEDYVLKASKTGLLSGTVLRLSNAVGAPVSMGVKCWQLIANDLARQVVESGEIVLRSSGRQQRNFIAIGDIVSFIEQILDSKQSQFRSQIINLGGSKSLTILELAQLLCKRSEFVLGKKPKLIVPEFPNKDHVVSLNFRIDKARRLGFSPNTGIESEIDATLMMCQEYFSK